VVRPVAIASWLPRKVPVWWHGPMHRTVS
jgi:hypothetical protein